MGRKPKQTMIEGTEPERIEEIEMAADTYREARDARMNKLETEIERKKELTTLMVVTLDGGEPKVKVSKVKREEIEV